MQQKMLHKKYRYLSKIDETEYSQKALKRKKFLGDFERACKDRSIDLFVLPPRMPKMNAFVERSNGTVKYEFYKLYGGSNSLGAIDCKLQQYKHFYNTYRPHRGLQEIAPLEYYQSMEAK